MQDCGMNIIWLFWPKGQHLTLFPVRHLSFGCQGCPASIGLTHSEPLMSTHWGTWTPLLSLFLFSSHGILFWMLEYTISTWSNQFLPGGLEIFQFQPPPIVYVFWGKVWGEACPEQTSWPGNWETKNFLLKWRAIWTWSPREMPQACLLVS